MGLAASQARFLGLTARKSNVEYKGQQVNQARTALSNQINGLYNDYRKLDAPTPPSKQDYVKTEYVLNTDGDYKYSISSFSKITSGEYEGFYNVALEYTSDKQVIYPYVAKDSVVTIRKNDDNSYSYINFKIGSENYTYDENDADESNITKIVVNGEDDEETINKYQGLKNYMKKYDLTSGTFYMFMKNNMPHYTSEDDLNNVEFSEVDGKMSYYGTYSFDYQTTQNDTAIANAIAAITQADSGRLTTIQIMASDDEELKNMVGYTYTIKTSQKDDEAGYEDAMNQYNYKNAIYQKAVEENNKKTELLQKEDRTLELQLNQLDTEQKALSTEIESVTKVIKETIESVFKTYE